jgi:hypothetical protein
MCLRCVSVLAMRLRRLAQMYLYVWSSCKRAMLFLCEVHTIVLGWSGVVYFDIDNSMIYFVGVSFFFRALFFSSVLGDACSVISDQATCQTTIGSNGLYCVYVSAASACIVAPNCDTCLTAKSGVCAPVCSGACANSSCSDSGCGGYYAGWDGGEGASCTNTALVVSCEPVVVPDGTVSGVLMCARARDCTHTLRSAVRWVCALCACRAPARTDARAAPTATTTTRAPRTHALVVV